MDNVDSKFINKLAVTASVLDKESQLIGEIGELIKKKKEGYVTKSNMERCSSYTHSWRLIQEIYAFMRYNNIKKIEEKKQTTDGIKEDCKFLHKIMLKYETTDKGMSFEELVRTKNIVFNIISLSGYHEDEYKTDELIDDTPQYW